MAINKKRSFFERLSGASQASDYDSFDDDLPTERVRRDNAPVSAAAAAARSAIYEDDSAATEGQLPVDVYQTASDIVIRAFVAGVRADDLNVSISRDMVVIEGSREERDQVMDADYFTRELFWGSFSRTILLPQEIDVENSSANAKEGLLSIVLPKHDKAKQTKLKVRVG
ncbi:MAG: Hsp20/alpha crystallin family protein [Candidatus Pacebacteria bacterium]|nr:Hsp20/alpha crystallin family protein [Candidatus Paceibacterota bacterium]MBP9840368.1 Hsp20/alpha crystallin family protein [Candidatus Paceibacterota bacterium]